MMLATYRPLPRSEKMAGLSGYYDKIFRYYLILAVGGYNDNGQGKPVDFEW